MLIFRFSLKLIVFVGVWILSGIGMVFSILFGVGKNGVAVF